MKFACVEYTTKSRAVWRHRPERPNYLCDPEREIDPTSFGCYTSALEGEHLPLTGLIYGSLAQPPTALRRVRQDTVRRLTGAFSRYDLSTLRRFDVLLVIYQISNDAELVRFANRVHAEFPNITLVSSSSPPFGRLREYWKDHPATAHRYRSFLDATHLNMNVCRATVPYYHLLTRTPSLYLPQPYPVEYARAQARAAEGDAPQRPQVPIRQPAERALSTSEEDGRGSFPVSANLSAPGEVQKRALRAMRQDGGAGRQDPPRQPILYVAGDTVRPDIMTGHLIARELQHKFPELLIRITKTPEFVLNAAFLRSTQHEVVPFLPWAEQLRALASVRLVINTDLWWTRGRVPVDCAAAGVPCVGTTSDGQTELWPDLSASDSTETDRLLAVAERALTDEAFRASVIAKAQRRLQHYSYARTVQRFSRAIELARTDRLGVWRDPTWDGDVLK